MNTRWAEVDHLDRAHAFRDALGEARRADRGGRCRRRRRRRLQPLPRPLARPDADVHARRGRRDRRRRARHTGGSAGDRPGAGPGDPRRARRRRLRRGVLGQAAGRPRRHPRHPVPAAGRAPARAAGRQLLRPAAAVARPLRRPGRRPRRRDRAPAGSPRRVAVVGSGGLSHQLPFPDWRAPGSDDDEFLVASWLEGRDHWADYEVRRRQIVVAAPPQLNERFDDDVLDRVGDGDARRPRRPAATTWWPPGATAPTSCATGSCMARGLRVGARPDAVLLADAGMADRHGRRRDRTPTRRTNPLPEATPDDRHCVPRPRRRRRLPARRRRPAALAATLAWPLARSHR